MTPTQYIQDVQKNKIQSSKWVKLAVERHLKDLKTAKSRNIYFDAEAGMRVVNFFSLLKHYKGTYQGQSFTLLPWQAFFIYCLFGWKKADGSRRFRYAYLKVARKNGKTTLAAGICLYALLADQEAGAEIYTAATTKFQASIAFKDAFQIISQEPYLKQMVETYQSSIVIPSTASSMRPVSSEDKVLDGLNPHLALIDEYHAHRDDAIFNIMKSGMGSRRQPMHLTITTAGFNKTSACFLYEKTCQEILSGIKEDDSQFCIMYDLDEEDDYLDEKVWIKANPSLGHTPSFEFLKQEVIQAKNNPSQLVNLLTKNFNQWTDSSATWIEDAKWMECLMPPEIDDEYLSRCTFIGSLDLAATKDMTAFAMLFLDEMDEKYYLKVKYYLPKESMLARVKRDGVRYDVWAEAGWITLTPGNVTDYRFIQQDVMEYCEKFECKGVGYDRWNSSQLVINLTDEGLEMIPYGQGYVSMSTPSKEFETMIYTKALLHDGNPVTRWMLSNIELTTDPAGNIKPDKAKSSEKIDGIVAAIVAIGVMLAKDLKLVTDGGPSRYDTEDGKLFVL